jgi:beta-glucan synthesis-associated protein KRE6
MELKEANPIDNHNMSYIGGMVTTWNKFCFTGGYIEGQLYDVDRR